MSQTGSATSTVQRTRSEGATRRIAILGTGRVGSALGEGWAARGHRIVFGSREPDSGRVQELLARAPGAEATTAQEAVRRADIAVLATPFGASAELLAGLDLDGKILIDATNHVGVTLEASSGAEQLAAYAPGARMAKAFNTTGTANMRAPQAFGEGGLDMFVCGHDDARAVAAELASDLGFRAIDCGGLDQAALLEHLALLWIHLVYRLGYGDDIAFRLVRR